MSQTASCGWLADSSLRPHEAAYELLQALKACSKSALAWLGNLNTLSLMQQQCGLPSQVLSHYRRVAHHMDEHLGHLIAPFVEWESILVVTAGGVLITTIWTHCWTMLSASVEFKGPQWPTCACGSNTCMHRLLFW